MNIGVRETPIIPFAPIRTRRFLGPSSSDPEQPRRASDVAQIEAIAADRERLLIEQGEAVISGIGIMMNTEMNAAQQQINQLHERERATALTSGLQVRRLELEAVAHVQRDHAQAEAVVQSVEANAQANVSELHTRAIQHAEQQAFQYQQAMQEVELFDPPGPLELMLEMSCFNCVAHPQPVRAQAAPLRLAADRQKLSVRSW